MQGMVWQLATTLSLVVGVDQMCKDPACWKNKVVYQILTDRFAQTDLSTNDCADFTDYCGGTWRGITEKLDYIAGLGADAIWLSPYVQNTAKGYHGYWAESFVRANEKFGTEEDLQALITAAHDRNMLVMVGVVANHMGQNFNDVPTLDPPFNNASMFHGCDKCFAAGATNTGENGCIDDNCNCWVTDYNNVDQCLVCQLFGLPDLDQSVQETRTALLNYASRLAEMGFDGMRLDTVPYVPQDFWTDFHKASNMTFMIGEVSTSDDSRCEPYISSQGMDSVLNYPNYYTLKSIFTSGASMQGLSDHLAQQRKVYSADTIGVLGNFASCHDVPRIVSLQPDAALRKNWVLYTLTAEGIPLIYYGEEQAYHGAATGTPDLNREPLWTSGYPTTNSADGMYEFVATVNSLRRRMPRADFADATQFERYVTPNLYVFMRGQVVVALTNGGSSASQVRETVPMLPWKQGTKVCNVFYPQADCLTITTDYQLEVVLNSGECKVYAPAEYMPEATTATYMADKSGGAASTELPVTTVVVGSVLFSAAAAVAFAVNKWHRKSSERNSQTAADVLQTGRHSSDAAL